MSRVPAPADGHYELTARRSRRSEAPGFRVPGRAVTWLLVAIILLLPLITALPEARGVGRLPFDLRVAGTPSGNCFGLGMRHARISSQPSLRCSKRVILFNVAQTFNLHQRSSSCTSIQVILQPRARRHDEPFQVIRQVRARFRQLAHANNGCLGDLSHLLSILILLHKMKTSSVCKPKERL